jgi:hypothetical protein
MTDVMHGSEAVLMEWVVYVTHSDLWSAFGFAVRSWHIWFFKVY